MKRSLSSLIIAALTMVLTNTLLAGVSVSPPVAEIVATPGKETLNSFTLKNIGEKPVRVRVEVTPVDKGDNVSEWLVIQPQEFRIDPEKDYRVFYIVTPPKGVKGELRCRVVFISEEIGEEKSIVGLRFNVPIYAIIQGTVKLDAEIKSAEVNYNYKQKTLSGSFIVENRSNIHIRPYIEIEIQDKSGRKVEGFKVPYGQVAQKDQERLFFLQKKDISLPEGEYTLLIKMDYGKLYKVKNRVATRIVRFVVKHKEGKKNEK